MRGELIRALRIIQPVETDAAEHVPGLPARFDDPMRIIHGISPRPGVIVCVERGVCAQAFQLPAQSRVHIPAAFDDGETGIPGEQSLGRPSYPFGYFDQKSRSSELSSTDAADGGGGGDDGGADASDAGYSGRR